MSEANNILVTVMAIPPQSGIVSNTYQLAHLEELIRLIWSDDFEQVLKKHSDGHTVWAKVVIQLKLSYLTEHHRDIGKAWKEIVRFLEYSRGIKPDNKVHHSETDTEVVWTFYLLPDTTVRNTTQNPTNDEDTEPFFVPFN